MKVMAGQVRPVQHHPRVDQRLPEYP
jgi:hypothetical protein